MFNVDDYIIYGGSGVCKVLDICPSPLKNGDKEKQYYKLKQIYEGKSIIYTPIDNNKIMMRKVVSEEEANELIDHINIIESTFWDDNRSREEECKTAINTYDCKELMKVCRGLHLIKEKQLEEGKKFSSIDNRYLKMTEELLLGEFSISLNKSKEQVEQLIIDRSRYNHN